MVEGESLPYLSSDEQSLVLFRSLGTPLFEELISKPVITPEDALRVTKADTFTREDIQDLKTTGSFRREKSKRKKKTSTKVKASSSDIIASVDTVKVDSKNNKRKLLVDPETGIPF